MIECQQSVLIKAGHIILNIMQEDSNANMTAI